MNTSLIKCCERLRIRGVYEMFILKKIREEKGISRYYLSEMSGVGESTIQMIENSMNPNPTFRTMCKIADALEVSLDELRGKSINDLTNISNKKSDRSLSD